MRVMSLQISPDTLPDYHFLFIAPNIEPGWVFEAAREYFNAFGPTIVTDAELIKIVPDTYTIAVSLLTRRDAFRTLAAQVAQARENAFLDALVYDTETEAALALNNRAANNQPFGVPLVPTETPSLRNPILPTPGAVVGGEAQAANPTATEPLSPMGFITMTPSPTPFIDGEDSVVVSPTPGAIVGDSEGGN